MNSSSELKRRHLTRLARSYTNRIIGVLLILFTCTVLLIVKVLPTSHQGDQNMASLRPSRLYMQRNTLEPDGRYLIYTSTSKRLSISDWGNHIVGMSSVYLLSVITNRTFGIDMAFPCPVNKFLEPNKIKWKVDDNWLPDTSENVINLTKSAFLLSIENQELSSLFREKVSYAVSDVDIRSYLVSKKQYALKVKWSKAMTCHDFYHKMYNELFVPSILLQETIKEFLKRAKPDPDSHLICAHIQIQDNKHFPKDGLKSEKDTSTKALWKFLKPFRYKANYRYFISSDSDYILHEAKWRFRLSIEDTIVNTVDACDNFHKILVNLYVLSHCDTLIISDGVPGLMAAFLRATRENLYYFNVKTIVPLDLKKTRSKCNEINTTV